MVDLYDTLIGAAPSSTDKAAAVAAALRRRQSFGELGALSGDKVLGPMGQRMIAQADSYADQIQNTRQKDADNLQTQSYQTGQLQHMGNVLKETMRNNTMSDETQRRGQDLALMAALARAQAVGSRGNKLTVSDRRDLTEGAGLVANMHQLLTTFKDDYAAPQVMGKSIPGVRPLSNALSAAGLGSKGMDAAQDWWATSDRLYNLFQRNKLFGATLTTNEMKAWAQANANKNMKPAQIKSMLASIMKTAEQELKSNVEGFMEGGYNPAQINALTQRARTNYVTPDPVVEEPDGEDFGDLTPEEIEELQALRKKYPNASP
jgi:hypothetical protein